MSPVIKLDHGRAHAAKDFPVTVADGNQLPTCTSAIWAVQALS